MGIDGHEFTNPGRPTAARPRLVSLKPDTNGHAPDTEALGGAELNGPGLNGTATRR